MRDIFQFIIEILLCFQIYIGRLEFLLLSEQFDFCACKIAKLVGSINGPGVFRELKNSSIRA